MLTLHGVGSQASIYCPLLAQPVKRPQYLSFDGTSPWQTSALQMSGLETLLLPSRLRNARDGYSLLVDMCQLFTSHSNRRNILQADLSIHGAHQRVNGVTNNSSHNDEQSHGANDDTNLSGLDIGLFPQVSNARDRIDTHRFSRLLIHRGGNATSADISSEYGIDDEPKSRSYSTELGFPYLTSFPTIFGNTETSNSLEVKSSLEATSTVANWLRELAGQTRILPSDEREDISSDLKAWADEYVEGWESDGSEDWDD
jgi:hypothetical protein